MLAAALALLSGCATITRGTTDELKVESDPSHARVTIHPIGIGCTTPCAIELKRKRDYVIEFRKEGYTPTRISVSSKFGGAGAAGLAGNVILGGLIGMGVDAASGATQVLRPNPVRAMLLPATTEAAALPVATTAPAVAAQPIAGQPIAGQPIAAPAAEPPPPAPAGANCIQPSIVDREACLGRLRLDMTKGEITGLLGSPDGTSRDQTTYRYGDRYLKFDASEKLVRISDRPL